MAMARILVAGVAAAFAFGISGCDFRSPDADVGRQIEILAGRTEDRVIRMSALRLGPWDEILVYGPYSRPDLPQASPWMQARFDRIGIDRKDSITAVALIRDGRVVDVGEVRRNHIDLVDVDRLTPAECVRLDDGWPEATKVAC
ncbi:MAG: hypothetical protein Q8R97_00010 [Brevundimonas sp.]|uniref:hypothetical protein n=1 Tax=Brevundimonas sp. TaxID=1871086 RepID=UPI0027375770|nr:hypothetical protein [Brevundimonas sp.]MDP3379567.1 hypothetical protein [Brevundimonas sp.]MDP3399486.1 hypothetical protein [Brevundimonas sp.]MDZ4113890.1 hypothetical protein [Brevundimonas sp.]